MGSVLSNTVPLALVTLLLVNAALLSNALPASCWSNGGFSTDPSTPKYGTHDWVAQHALDWLPQQEKQFILDNLASFLLGTELPDSSQPPDGMNDRPKHHVYYFSDGALKDDAAGARAQQEYENAAVAVLSGDVGAVCRRLGAMCHYIADVAVFGHVMGAETAWGAEDDQHHSGYETYVNNRTDQYDDEFSLFLTFDGRLENVTARDAALAIAYDTTFDVDGDLTCVWMNQNYDWGSQTFENRCGESLNLAVNVIADVLHTFWLAQMVPEFPSLLAISLVILPSLALAVCAKKLTGARLLKRRLVPSHSRSL